VLCHISPVWDESCHHRRWRSRGYTRGRPGTTSLGSWRCGCWCCAWPSRSRGGARPRTPACTRGDSCRPATRGTRRADPATRGKHMMCTISLNNVYSDTCNYNIEDILLCKVDIKRYKYWNKHIWTMCTINAMNCLLRWCCNNYMYVHTGFKFAIYLLQLFRRNCVISHASIFSLVLILIIHIYIVLVIYFNTVIV